MRPALSALLLGLLVAGCASMRPLPPSPPDADLVVLVHGMGRTPASMRPMERALRRAGFRTLNVAYRSTGGASVASAGSEVAAAVSRELALRPSPRVHVVGHSLGGIALRWMLAHAWPAGVPIGRVVLIATPNQGSHAADRYASTLGRWQTPMRDLRTAARGGTVASMPLPPPSVEVAVVAGDADGKVWVSEALLPGARATVVVPGTHTWLMHKPRLQRLTVAFLRTGAMSRQIPP